MPIGASAQAQADSSIDASPSPFTSSQTITVTASVESGSEPPYGYCEEPDCYLGEPLTWVWVTTQTTGWTPTPWLQTEIPER